VDCQELQRRQIQYDTARKNRPVTVSGNIIAAPPGLPTWTEVHAYKSLGAVLISHIPRALSWEFSHYILWFTADRNRDQKRWAVPEDIHFKNIIFWKINLVCFHFSIFFLQWIIFLPRKYCCNFTANLYHRIFSIDLSLSTSPYCLDRIWGLTCLLSTEYWARGGGFLRSKAAGAWSWPLTSK
jgi:hypothetical protein